MDKLHQTRTEFLDQETVLRWALEATDRGLFDADEFEEDDLASLHNQVGRRTTPPRPAHRVPRPKPS